MTKIWKPLDIETYKSWVNIILSEVSDDLNDWETKFIESISERLARNQQLTEFQAVKLESIYAEKTN